jgi:predicted AAA+ superfamily ATPase
VAAGSLLEFALGEIPSFGVGRIRSLFVYPLSFDEYLKGMGESSLLKAKSKATLEKPLAGPIHKKLLNHVKRFMILGGMPEVVSSYVQNRDLNRCGRILDDLITSLKADFAKYKKHVPFLRISEVFDSVLRQSGGKFVYVKAATEANHKQIKEAGDLLIMAGLVIPVTHTAANGLPLGAEVNPRQQKMLPLDTGIFQRLLGLNITDVLFEDDFDVINKRAIAEQFVGLELLKYASCYRQQNLFFWRREARNSNAEIDYIIQQNENIIPVEVKSGRKGSMQSMFLFLEEKKAPFGIRLSLENFGTYQNIRVMPIYAIAELKYNR